MLRIPNDKINVSGATLHPETFIEVKAEFFGPHISITLFFGRNDINDPKTLLYLASLLPEALECSLSLTEVLNLAFLKPNEGRLSEDVFSTVAELAFLKSLKRMSFSVQPSMFGEKGIAGCLVDFGKPRRKISATLHGVDPELGVLLFKYFC
jgi:hypothetical protein